MPKQARSIPDEILYHFVTKPQSVDNLFSSLYDQPSEIIKQHFMATNAHLGKQVRPGQMVIFMQPKSRHQMPSNAHYSRPTWVKRRAA